MKVAVLTSGFSPVPAVEGGAVENLVELILKENEVKQDLDIELYSVHNEKAEMLSSNYKCTKFRYCKPDLFAQLCDKFIYSRGRTEI